MATLTSVINEVYLGFGDARLGWRSQTSGNSVPTTTTKYIEIPIDKDLIEVPIFAWQTFMEEVSKESPSSAIVAALYSMGVSTTYKSLESILKAVLAVRINTTRLIKVTVPNTSIVYYATLGALFDSSLKPIMMMSWLVGKNNAGYVVIRPLLRIDPDVWLNKEDSMQRFLSGKLVTSTLTPQINRPTITANNVMAPSSRMKVKVEIDNCPFFVKTAKTPSISTTNEELLQTVEDYIEDLL